MNSPFAAGPPDRHKSRLKAGASAMVSQPLPAFSLQPAVYGLSVV